MNTKRKVKFVVCNPLGSDWGPFYGDPADLRVTWTGAGGPIELRGFADGEFLAAHFVADRPGEYRRDSDPRPGRYACNGVPRSLLPRRHGPPRDEGAWARRLVEIRREAQQREADEMTAHAESRRHLPSGALDKAIAHARALAEVKS